MSILKLGKMNKEIRKNRINVREILNEKGIFLKKDLIIYYIIK